jgi:hypothetical protein
MRRPLIIYNFATAPIPNFLISEENLIFFFISVGCMCNSGASLLCVHNNAIAGLRDHTKHNLKRRKASDYKRTNNLKYTTTLLAFLLPLSSPQFWGL